MGQPTESVPFFAPDNEPRLLAERNGQRLMIVPHAMPGIGEVIVDPEAPSLIPGVEVEPFVQWPDDRGSFGELFRFGSPGIARDFVSSNTHKLQVSIAVTYPSVIKAIHYHFEQTDLWVPVAGMIQILLCDLRESSPACGRINTLFVGELRRWKVRIPPGVGHGYKVLGDSHCQLIYAMNRQYNPDDEGRLPFNDPGINYDWAIRNR